MQDRWIGNVNKIPGHSMTNAAYVGVTCFYLIYLYKACLDHLRIHCESHSFIAMVGQLHIACWQLRSQILQLTL